LLLKAESLPNLTKIQDPSTEKEMIKRAEYLDPFYEERLEQDPSTEKEMIKRAEYLEMLCSSVRIVINIMNSNIEATLQGIYANITTISLPLEIKYLY
jgi:hypothetical protein